MKWTRGEELGEGSCASVYKARTHHEENIHIIPQVIAVKTAKTNCIDLLSKEKELLDKFKECPYIISCYGHEYTMENNTKLYNIFLEYASGGCLFDRIVPNKGVPEKLVKKYTQSILVALSHIHRQGYVHCDIKPGNILLVQEEGGQEITKLADFGVSKRIQNCDELVRGNCLVGTPLYAAPESIMCNEYWPKSDIWSLGVTVLLLLTGKYPPELDDYAYHLHFLKQINSSNKISNKLSKDAKDFLRKCLVSNPRDRFSSDALLHHPFLIKMEVSSSRFHLMAPIHCFHFTNRMVHAS